MSNSRIMSPGKNGQLINEFGLSEKPPQGWTFLPAGDAAVTRKVTAAGDFWRVQVKKGRRMQSLGIWAPAENISGAKKAVADMRSAPDYEKKKASAAKSRDKKQEAYKLEFEEAVRQHLSFHSKYKALEVKMAKLVTEHAIPVGSGTVARTAMIPIEERAGKAVIAWMRHKTTGYDNMKIARIKGERRAVRKKLAQGSVKVLNSYRRGDDVVEGCMLYRALSKA
ncbi:DUF2293 domain-containing protein [Fulvivirga sediminis]|uniref:DUF2293 domain-containing protein n=1 Tax=Fulvivirga sediminis TaxID=2803949 RepID=A0A937K1A6_9BACT|nr:DUF2293 domain-containing protein [Fulvivirga sediminis]MBL3657266.1 DUF2293 domain-containing protein [Fulvivirga sediminis]